MNFRHFSFPTIFFSAIVSFAATKQAAPEPPRPSHVEKIIVVDSIAVDRYNFFKNYRMQPSAGSILSSSDVESLLRGVDFPDDFEGKPHSGFTNEFNDFLIWAQVDSTGYLRLAESVRLIDGKWSTPEFTPPILNFGSNDYEPDSPVDANAMYPFMDDDGQTLYFASDNDASMGGFDIFVASRDPSDGSYLIPRNLGLPFNSEFDDYMMAFDKETGVGWWATDRNQLGDLITIYIYALPESRVNVDPDDENLLNFATLSDWQSLLDDDALRESERLRDEIARISTPSQKTYDFSFPVAKGVTYHYFSDFKNPKAAAAMQSYLRDLRELEAKKRKLSDLRKAYFKSGKKSGDKIRSLEAEIRSAEKDLKSRRSEVYRLETSR